MRITTSVSVVLLAFALASCSKHTNAAAGDSTFAPLSNSDIAVPDTLPNGVAQPNGTAMADSAQNIHGTFDVRTVSLSNLPPGVREYVGKQYPGYAITRAAPDSLCDGTHAARIDISKTGSPAIALYVGANGTYLERAVMGTFHNIPTTVTENFQKQFSGTRPSQTVQVVTLANGGTEYAITIAQGSNRREIMYNKDGTVVCQRIR